MPVLLRNMVFVPTKEEGLRLSRGGVSGNLSVVRAYWRFPQLKKPKKKESPTYSKSSHSDKRVIRNSLGWLQHQELFNPPKSWEPVDLLVDSTEEKRSKQRERLVTNLRDTFGLKFDNLEDNLAPAYMRFYTVRQLLDLVSKLHCPVTETNRFVSQVRHLLSHGWFVAIDNPSLDCEELLKNRVETISFSVLQIQSRKEDSLEDRNAYDYLWLKASRNIGIMPDYVRAYVQEGLDPVHTPENSRAGLARFIGVGFEVGNEDSNEGRLVQVADRSRMPEHVFPDMSHSSASIPFASSNTPRRLMLGAALQTQAVPLVNDMTEEHQWPHGVELLASYSLFDGWTHEDGYVVSQTAADRLQASIDRQIVVLVPAAATNVEVLVQENSQLRRGESLIKAYIDLFAMGLSIPEAHACHSSNGWLEIKVKGNYVDTDCTVTKVEIQPTPESPRYSHLVILSVRHLQPLGVGDKLSTRHGLKGVVAKILPDEEMPKVGSKCADIILSPFGVLSRGAMGQFRESIGDKYEKDSAFRENWKNMKAGNVFVMRQPQIAGHPNKYRVTPPKKCDVTLFQEGMVGQTVFESNSSSFSLYCRTSRFWNSRPLSGIVVCEDDSVGTDRNVWVKITRPVLSVDKNRVILVVEPLSDEEIGMHSSPLKITQKGQRYGEMEFWALMAHGADKISKELLSSERCLSYLLDKEQEQLSHCCTYLWEPNSAIEGKRASYMRRDLYQMQIIDDVLIDVNEGPAIERVLVSARNTQSMERAVRKIKEVLFDRDTSKNSVLRKKRIRPGQRFIGRVIVLRDSGAIVELTGKLTETNPAEGKQYNPMEPGIYLLMRASEDVNSAAFRSYYLNESIHVRTIKGDRAKIRFGMAQTELTAEEDYDPLWVSDEVQDLFCNPFVESGTEPSEHESSLPISSSRAYRIALNRYLQALGMQLKDGSWCKIGVATDPKEVQQQGKNSCGSSKPGDSAARDPSDSIAISGYDESLKPKNISSLEDRGVLGDEAFFKYHLNRVQITFEKAIVFTLRFGKRAHRVSVKNLPILPPWLRPDFGGKKHPLTKQYELALRLSKAEGFAATHRKLKNAVRNAVRIIGGEVVEGVRQPGVGTFVKRELLGRRLSRSARAVIVPAPDLRVDEIRVPQEICDIIFEGLPSAQRRLVLVNRNPTLTRRGLLALKPVPDPNNNPVFGMPLGLLSSMAADFDGDQACIVALETKEAIDQAEELLMPGCSTLRHRDFEPSKPAFALVKELSVPGKESQLAQMDVSEISQDEWCNNHYQIQTERIEELSDGWESIHEMKSTEKKLVTADKLWKVLTEQEWKSQAKAEMNTVYTSVRKKGQFGGILRQQVFRRRFNQDSQLADFYRGVSAVHAVTEPLTQAALSSKSGGGSIKSKPRKFFDSPDNNSELFDEIETHFGNEREYDRNTLTTALNHVADPDPDWSFLEFLTSPTLLQLLDSQSQISPNININDPRIGWYLF